MFCYNCGQKIEDNAAFCVFCGADQREEDFPAVAVTPEPVVSAPVVPVAPVVPAQPVASVAPVAVEPEIPVQPTVPDIPDIPEVPTAPIVPLVVNLPEEPEASAAPAQPEIPVQPVAPAAPVQPEVSAEPVAPAEPAPFALNIPEIDEIPDVPAAPAAPAVPAQPVASAAPVAPVAPTQPVAPAAPVAPAVPAQPVAPAQPMAPAAPAQPMAPAAPAQPEEAPKKKKTWIVWVVVLSILLLLAAGAVGAYFYWQGQNAHKDALESLMTVAVEGDFSQIDELAPKDYWDKAGVDKAQLAGAGDLWIKEVLSERLQESFKSRSDAHYDSFRISPEPEISVDQEVDASTKQELLTTLQAKYGITAKRVTDVRYLEIHITLSGNIGNIEDLSSCKEDLFMVQMGDCWYPVDTHGNFAVDRIVQLMRPVLMGLDTDKEPTELVAGDDTTKATKSTKKATKSTKATSEKTNKK